MPSSPSSSSTKVTNRKRTKSIDSSDKTGKSASTNIDQASEQHHKHMAEVKEEMAKYVIWRRPFFTVLYFLLELIDLIVYYIRQLLTYRKLVMFILLTVSSIVGGFYIEGNHLQLLIYMRKQLIWYAYWMGLGIASSIGLGTGLHTFLLYLGPFIAQVTLAAYECGSLDFPEPPYPDNIICPNSTATTVTAASNSIHISILAIMSKVRWESFMWGAGTALGELPPYFMARAHAISAKEDRKSHAGLEDEEEDEELAEFEQLLKAEEEGRTDTSLLDRMRLAVFKLIKRVGFWGILLCASIPNPLFDLAGITCGHFLVRFSTFFGATLIGKAIIKMHIQQTFVIFLFSEHYLDQLFELLARVPGVGARLYPILHQFLHNEKKKLHRQGNNADNSTSVESSENILSWVLGKIVLLMVAFFVISIVNSLAQRRYKRLQTAALQLPLVKSEKSKASKKKNTIATQKIAND